MGQVALQTPAASPSDRLGHQRAAIRWLGVAEGLGEPRGSTEALRLVENLAKGNDPLRGELLADYKNGYEEGRKLRTRK